MISYVFVGIIGVCVYCHREPWPMKKTPTCTKTMKLRRVFKPIGLLNSKELCTVAPGD